MSCDNLEHAAPYQEVDPKRVADKVPIQFDWHDYLANTWRPGTFFTAGQRIRFLRNDPRARGFEMECTVAGRSGGRPPTFPGTLGASVTEGGSTLTWTARTLSTASLRGTIGTSVFPPVDGLILSDESNADLIYTIYADVGVSGQRYEVKQRITLSDVIGEEKEGVAVLFVID